MQVSVAQTKTQKRPDGRQTAAAVMMMMNDNKH